MNTQRPANPWPSGIALVAMALGILYLQRAVHWRQAALFAVGAVAGIVLYHAAFGFAPAWRVVICDRRGGGLRAQMLMLAIACAVFFPILASGQFFGQAVRGASGPLALSVIAGAFIFGVGMQLADG